MNLLNDRWLSTDKGLLSVTEALRVAGAPMWGRGDWDAATRVLLVAALQTAIAQQPRLCPDESTWQKFRHSPPPKLDDWFAPLVPAFDDGAFEMPVDKDADRVNVSVLLPEAPSANTTTKNADIAMWRTSVRTSLPENEARIALYSDALWGTRWGRGHRQGVRGESRMLTLVEADGDNSLWESVWLNVLPANRWERLFGKSTGNPFPWTQKLRKTVSPQNSNSLEVYWAMPRRLRLVNEAGNVVGLLRQPNGIDYQGWKHPLTPYRVAATKEVVAVRIAPGHIGYGDWVGIATLGGPPGSTPAMVVSEFIQRRWEGGSLRLRACGWALVDAGSPGVFVEQTVPLMPTVDAELVKGMLDAAIKRSRRLDDALKRLHVNTLRDRLFAETEADWYERLRAREAGDWDKLLHRTAIRLFDKATDLRGNIGKVMQERSRV